jgi:hypothetical protein
LLAKIKKNTKKTHKNLRISKKSSNFAAWKSGGVVPLELLKILETIKTLYR